MTKHIRVLEKKPNPSFGERLEERAREIVNSVNLDGDSTTRSIENELALTLSHLDGVREVHETLRRNLLRQECYLDTEILQREPREPVYEDTRLEERDMLRDRLRKIEQERRTLLLKEEEQIQGIRDRVLDLVSKRGILGA